jgi:hypothetical protein
MMKMKDQTNPMEAAARLFAEGIATHLVPLLRDQLATMSTAPSPAPPPAKFITTKDVADMLGRSAFWVRERKEVFGGRKPPGSKYLYFDRDQVEAYIRNAGHINPKAA